MSRHPDPRSPPRSVSKAPGSAGKPDRPRSSEAVLVAHSRRCSGLPGGLPATAYRYELVERCRLTDRTALAERARQTAEQRRMVASVRQQDRSDHTALSRALQREFGGDGPPPAELNTPSHPEGNATSIQWMLAPAWRVKYPDPLERFLAIQREFLRKRGSLNGRLSRYQVLMGVHTALAHALQAGPKSK